MSSKELGGKRSYKTDFEIYDERAADHQNIVLDIYRNRISRAKIIRAIPAQWEEL